MKINRYIKISTAVILALCILMSALPVSGASSSYSSLKKNSDYHYGIDVSKWNGDLDWAKLKEQGVEFAFIRIGTYSNSGGKLDEKFKQNVKSCVENGIEFGVYVYTHVYKHAKAKACARWVAKKLKSMGNYCKDKDTIQVAYDIEDSTFKTAVSNKKITKTYLQNSIIKFTNVIKNKGYVPVVYSYESFFNDYLNITALQNKNIKIWYARWPNKSKLDVTIPYVMSNNTSPEIWQYASSYYINGVLLDTDVCYDDFYDYDNEDSKLTVSGLKDSYAYNSNGVKPKIEVYNGKTLLTEDTDYTLKYFSNKSSGIGRIKIIRYNKSGNYVETKTVKFIIRPKKVSNLSATASATSVNLSWNKLSGAKNYKVFMYDEDSESYILMAKTTDTSYKIGGLSSGKKYTFAIKAGKEIEGKVYYSNYNEISKYTKFKKMTINSLLSEEEGNITVKWEPVDRDNDGYEVQYSTNSSFKKSKTKTKLTTNNAKKIIRNLTSGKKYYVRVRSYLEKGSKTVYSVYSDALSIEVK